MLRQLGIKQIKFPIDLLVLQILDGTLQSNVFLFKQISCV